MVKKRGGRNPARPRPPEVDLLQYEADFLIDVPKVALELYRPVEFFPGMSAEVDAVQENGKERFRIIVDRSNIDRRHAKYELMVRNSVVLLRLEFHGSPHRNPDGETIACPHLHRYRQEDGDRWARHTPTEFGDPGNLLACLLQFLRYCNVVQCPLFTPRREMFS